MNGSSAAVLAGPLAIGFDSKSGMRLVLITHTQPLLVQFQILLGGWNKQNILLPLST